MKLLELHIYGYGKIENKQYTLKDLQLFFGENEAGKSTIMSFIHSMLFGFPTKQQSLLRYVPKTSTEYGGKILCQIEGEGIVSIQRIKGKATGDVTVQFEDGRMEGEDTLQRLLGRMDRTTYQNIFSFNLEGIQNIQRLKKEELNRYLFTAGSTGTDTLLRLEQDWQKERDRLFKKSGRKPKINEVITQLKSLEKQVREGKEKNEQYLPLVDKRSSLEENILSSETEKEALSERKEDLIAAQENWGTLVQYKEVEERLSQLKDIEFPTKGLERLNELKIEERQISSYIETLTAKQEKLQQKIVEENAGLSLLNEIPFMEKILSRQTYYLKWNEERSERNRELIVIQRKISDTLRELGLDIEMESIPTLNTSLMMSDQIQQSVEQYTKLLHDRESLLKQYEEGMEELHSIERKCEILENRLMPEDEYQDLQRAVKAQSRHQASQDQMQWMNMQLQESEESYSRKKATFSQQMVLSSTALLLLLGISAWGIFKADWFIAAVCFILIAVVGVTGMQSRKALSEEARSLHKIRTRVNELKPREEKNDYSPERIEQSLKEQMEFRNEWKQRILSLEEQEGKIHKLDEKKKWLEKEIVVVEEKIAQLKASLRLPPEFNWKSLRDAFGKMKELVYAYETFTHLSEQVASISRNVSDYVEECKMWFQRHSMTFTSVEESFIQIKKIMQDQKKQQLTIENAQSELEPLSLEVEKRTIENRKIRDDINALFKDSGCVDETAFREKAIQVEERDGLWSQYSGMRTRLTGRTLSTFAEFDAQEEIMKAITLITQSIDQLSLEVSTQQKELASVVYEIKMLEEGKSYSSILQEFQSKKAELQELANEWSGYTLAQISLNKTIELYQKTKMPKVLQQAEEIFRELTEGHYQRIFLLEDEMIKVERKDGSVFHAVELSQGTKEQLYISIRFALIQSFRDKYPLPVLIDDGVVNFDQDRTQAFLKLLRKMAVSHQMIFFTCHPHVKDTFDDDEVIRLYRNESIRIS
ncbi:AAA family ATPase [Rossellomorea sp. NPDC077527]|uniref:AAA family ATPase n=1 Tax=Rossellomorea sp. NPDC077527 TaxID=3364510 RepID=UPI0037CA6574